MLPKRTFKNSKGFQAQADVHINSPTQSQANNQNVNVVITPTAEHSSGSKPSFAALTKDRAFKLITNANKEDSHVNPENEQIGKQSLTADADNDVKNRDIKLDVGLDDGLEEHLKERSITTAQQDLEEMQAIINDKEHLIQALALIVDLYQNNPLIINKYIIPEENELIQLLFLLTGAEEIELIKNDPDLGCNCKFGKFERVNKIMVKKNDNTYNFKYSFPNVVQLLDNRNISWKYVC